MTKRRSWHGLHKQSSPFGFGCWQISGAHDIDGKPHGWGNVDEGEAVEIIQFAMENGITFFDTAQGYNFGKSERILGRAIRDLHQEVVVCTKIPLSLSEISRSQITNEFIRKVEQSLDNLMCSTIDILLLHNPPDDIDWSTFDFHRIEELVESGTIGTFGVSAKGLDGAINAAKHRIGSTIEWAFNLFERRPVEHIFPLIRKNKMNFIARSPLSRGLINTRYVIDNPNFDENDFRSTLPNAWQNWVITQLRSLESRGIDADHIVEYAFNFIRSYSEVTALIPGIKTMNQLKSYISIKNRDARSFNYLKLKDLPKYYPEW